MHNSILSHTSNRQPGQDIFPFIPMQFDKAYIGYGHVDKTDNLIQFFGPINLL